MEHFTSITINLSGQTRTESVNGRKFIVAPVSILVQGVLNGSQGPLFYPSEEIERDVYQWNGRPIVNGHPVVDGNGISANSPSVIAEYEIGRIYNSNVITENGKRKLVCDAWFDVEMTRAVNPKILKKLEQGKPIEVSTGLFTDNVKAPKNAEYEGKPYTYIARNFRPDHLAILLDEKGACSVKDGCGVFNSDGKLTNNPSWVKDGTIWQKAKEQAQEQGKGDEYEIITEIYKRMGGTVGNEKDNDKQSCNCGGTCSNGCNNPNNSVISNSSQESIDMAFKNRTEVIDWFVINVNKNASKSLVNEMTDEQILESVIQNAKNKMEGEDTSAFMKWMTSAPADIQNAMVQLMKSQMSGKNNQFPAKKEEEKPDPTKTNPQATQTPANPNPANPNPAAKKPEEEDKNKMPMNNKEKTVEEYLNDPTIPAPIKEAFIVTMNKANKEKAEIIQKLVANLSDDKKAKAVEYYSKMSFESLEKELEFRPTNNSNQQIGIIPVTHYLGNAGGSANPTNNNTPVKRAPLEPITMNYEELAKERR